jgi:undecaprenyl-diphosphatase
MTAERAILFNFFVMAVCAWAFVKLAHKIRRGRTDQIDNRLLRVFRRRTNLAIPIGPAWLLHVAQDVTALGSGTNLFFSSAILVGAGEVERNFRTGSAGADRSG